LGVVSWSTIDLGPRGQSGQQDNQAKCDFRLARIFGDDDAVMATLFEPTTLLDKYNGVVGKRKNAGANRHMDSQGYNPRESPENGVAHLYARATGEGKADGFAYTPSGYLGKPFTYTGPNSNSSDEIQTNYAFTYLPGSLKKFGYNGGLRINFVHSGTTNLKGKLLPPDPSVTNKMGSIKVGVIGNYGVAYETGGNGTVGYFVHNHMLFNVVDKHGRRGKRIDPRTVFCKDFGF
jgi:hypothetical protein